ncbi:SDR family oxidoreductase [Streptomyces sp. ZAF1911]|uniref:SDR family oxidoreductase n=1 Tax=Streptomyces sp. ZAF1911 TaxID=2944129 RepID=UPI00237B2D3D|nr:SDR family oxidoreductase [Streptomyces sp. ZAF1911]MDD9381114.1 SDR family oxidoreductase [Streptomyces sp. ZAF1911]
MIFETPCGSRVSPWTSTVVARQCVPRRGQPEDVAAAITFLANPHASFITAESLTIDGGWMPH